MGSHLEQQAPAGMIQTRERKSPEQLLAAQGDQGSTEGSEAASSTLPLRAGSRETVVI